ncbi:NAD(P)H-binding protein [Winogradskyella sediminis]|uniref:NAD(P)H-binding protein n=1 Tax=Winogradskyella sediminis TaxID=1382466 RepID=UPI000E23F64F|nr:NAD(P)H-binding protein [Winogradskyella sediminis]REG86205.1 putative NAD(P)-binding protein [Winogradskyella sediminis]
MKKTAIILGASGLTGGKLLQKLIKDERYASIKLFSRSKMEGLPDKVTQYIGDLLELNQFKAEFTADEVYCCIGTTKEKTPDKTLYKQIDCGIPSAAAKLSKANGIATFIVISAMGANADSAIFYNKTKGEMEQQVMAQALEHTYILRPSLIGGDRQERRVLEKIGLVLFKGVQPLLIGPLKAYRIVTAETIAQAMLHLANTIKYPEVLIPSDDIQNLGNNF